MNKLKEVIVKLPVDTSIKTKCIIPLLKWFQRNVDKDINKISLRKNKEGEVENDDIKDKLIFKVLCDVDASNDKVNKEDFHVVISKGVTGTEMSYALSALLSVVIAHENANGDKWSVDGFLHYIGVMIKGSEIGVPEKETEND